MGKFFENLYHIQNMRYKLLRISFVFVCLFLLLFYSHTLLVPFIIFNSEQTPVRPNAKNAFKLFHSKAHACKPTVHTHIKVLIHKNLFHKLLTVIVGYDLETRQPIQRGLIVLLLFYSSQSSQNQKFR